VSNVRKISIIKRRKKKDTKKERKKEMTKVEKLLKHKALPTEMTKVEKLLKHKDLSTEMRWNVTQQVTPLTRDATKNLPISSIYQDNTHSQNYRRPSFWEQHTLQGRY
jgi:hypothetical protein